MIPEVDFFTLLQVSLLRKPDLTLNSEGAEISVQ